MLEHIEAQDRIERATSCNRRLNQANVFKIAGYHLVQRIVSVVSDLVDQHSERCPALATKACRRSANPTTDIQYSADEAIQQMEDIASNQVMIIRADENYGEAPLGCQEMTVPPTPIAEPFVDASRSPPRRGAATAAIVPSLRSSFFPRLYCLATA